MPYLILINLAIFSSDSSKSLSVPHEMLFIGAGLGSKGSTLDLKLANQIFFLSYQVIFRSVGLLYDSFGSDQL